MYEYEFDIYSEETMIGWFRNGSTPDTHAIFEGLPHYTEFKFRVKALTSVGSGPFSQFVIGRTLPSGELSGKKGAGEV